MHAVERALEHGKRSPAEGVRGTACPPQTDAIPELLADAHGAGTMAERIDAYRALGAIAGRAYDATWEVAERAAFALLEIAREADTPAERLGLLSAMGRAFRNAWLIPYVHRRLSDENESVAMAAIGAAGGLAFPALEGALVPFLEEDSNVALRLSAIRALGRMGAESAAPALVRLITKDVREGVAALAALTEIRSRTGEPTALELLARDPPHDVVVAAVHYLAEIGSAGVVPYLRRLARADDPALRIASGLAARALRAETARDADERILTALTERDRAARAALARRLRTLDVKDTIARAEVLFADDPDGIIQIIGEVRAPEVTRFLVDVANDKKHAPLVRARAARTVEANEAWERDALAAIACGDDDPVVREAATQALGAFVPLAYVADKLGALAEDPIPTVRAAFLWAVQLAARGASAEGVSAEGARGTACPPNKAEAIVRRALSDEDPTVRRRAAYVAGNLDLANVIPDLVKLVQKESDRKDLRIAAFVAIGEIGSPARFADLVFSWNREDDADVLGAASRAIERSLLHAGDEAAPQSLDRAHDRIRKLLRSEDARVRASALRVAGLSKGAIEAAAIVAMKSDSSPRVREQVAVALGRLSAAEGGRGTACPPETSIKTLVEFLADPDTAVQERAAHALLSLKTSAAVAPVLAHVSKSPDGEWCARIVSSIELPEGDTEAFATAVGEALAVTDHDHPAYESLMALKVLALEASRPATSREKPIDQAITELFPMWPKLAAARGFEPLAKSLRTAELLYGTARTSDADFSAAIVLWMKCLEGYMHAWLGPRLRSLQMQPTTLWDVAGRLSWPTYERHLSSGWLDPVKVGALSVDVPLRSVVNALSEYQQRRLKMLDSPSSVTEWSRLMLFFAVDHATGPRNVLKLASEPSHTIKLAHRLQVLAQVRNAVTHRVTASASTLEEFRVAYYSAFSDLTKLA